MVVVEKMVGIVEPHLMMLVEMVVGFVVLGVFGLDFGCWKRREPLAFGWPHQDGIRSLF